MKAMKNLFLFVTSTLAKRIVPLSMLIFVGLYFKSFGQEKSNGFEKYGIADIQECITDLSELQGLNMPQYWYTLEELVEGKTYYLYSIELEKSMKSIELGLGMEFNTYKVHGSASKKQLKVLEESGPTYALDEEKKLVIWGDGNLLELNTERIDSATMFFKLPVTNTLSSYSITFNDTTYLDQMLVPLKTSEVRSLIFNEEFTFLGLKQGFVFMKIKGILILYPVSQLKANDHVFLRLNSTDNISYLMRLNETAERVFGLNQYFILDTSFNEIQVSTTLQRTVKRTLKGGQFDKANFLGKVSNRNISPGYFLAFATFGGYNMDSAYISIHELPNLIFSEVGCFNKIIGQKELQDAAIKQSRSDSLSAEVRKQKVEQIRSALYSCQYSENEVSKFDGVRRISTLPIQVLIKELPAESLINFEYRLRRVGNDYFAEFQSHKSLGCATDASYVKFKLVDGTFLQLFHEGKIDCGSRPKLLVQLDSKALQILQTKEIEMIRIQQHDHFSDVTILYPDFMQYSLKNCLN